MNNFLFLGGDMRSLYAAKRLNESYDCFVYGFMNRRGENYEGFDSIALYLLIVESDFCGV